MSYFLSFIIIINFIHVATIHFKLCFHIEKIFVYNDADGLEQIIEDYPDQIAAIVLEPTVFTKPWIPVDLTISTLTFSEILTSTFSLSITLSTVPTMPPEVITLSPLLSA